MQQFFCGLSTVVVHFRTLHVVKIFFSHGLLWFTVTGPKIGPLFSEATSPTVGLLFMKTTGPKVGSVGSLNPKVASLFCVNSKPESYVSLY